MRALTLPLLTSSLLLLVGACQTIAGIEDRKLDPNARPSGDSADCISYCDSVMEACTGENAVYTTKELCLGVCKQLPAGDPLEPVGNTLACRVQEAKAAEREPADHCRFVGPGGGDKCGSDCEAYCDLFPKVCGEEGSPEYPNTAACLKACGGLIDQDRFDVVLDHEGDSIECRLVHVSSATVKPGEHCAHAPIIPAEPWCTGKADAAPSCEEYCKIELAACDGDLLQYESEQQCLDVCGLLTPGVNSDQKLNTVGCRRYHSFSATLAQSAETHCSHSGPTGDGHCVGDADKRDIKTGNCDSYCQLVAAACPTEFAAQLKTDAQCKTECALLEESQEDAKYSIPAAKASKGLSCRVLNTARAISDPMACAAALGAAPCQ